MCSFHCTHVTHSSYRGKHILIMLINVVFGSLKKGPKSYFMLVLYYFKAYGYITMVVVYFLQGRQFRWNSNSFSLG